MVVLFNICFLEIIEWDENLLVNFYVLFDEVLVEIIKIIVEIVMVEIYLFKGNKLY